MSIERLGTFLSSLLAHLWLLPTLTGLITSVCSRWLEPIRPCPTRSASCPSWTAATPTSSWPIMGPMGSTELRSASAGSWRNTSLCRRSTHVSHTPVACDPLKQPITAVLTLQLSVFKSSFNCQCLKDQFTPAIVQTYSVSSLSWYFPFICSSVEKYSYTKIRQM